MRVPRCKFPKRARPVPCCPKFPDPFPRGVRTGAGITVALGNSHEDNWEWHMYDTVEGFRLYQVTRDAIEYM